MLVIGIETSGLSGGVALTRNGECVESRALDQVGRRHAQSLVLELRELLTAHRLAPRDVDAIAVSRGPGSFTGLRVGLVCAKTFAYATGCRFVAVDTFATIAMNCPAEINDLWIVEDAQRGDLVVGRYLRADDEWKLTTPVATVIAEEWLPLRTAAEVLTGRGLLRCDLSASSARFLTNDEFVRPLASNVARLGTRMLLNPEASPSDIFDFWKAVPFYMRPSAAEETRDKKDAARRDS